MNTSKKIATWWQGENKLNSQLYGERYTNGEVVLVNVGVILALIALGLIGRFFQ